MHAQAIKSHAAAIEVVGSPLRTCPPRRTAPRRQLRGAVARVGERADLRERDGNRSRCSSIARRTPLLWTACGSYPRLQPFVQSSTGGGMSNDVTRRAFLRLAGFGSVAL